MSKHSHGKKLAYCKCRILLSANLEYNFNCIKLALKPVTKCHYGIQIYHSKVISKLNVNPILFINVQH